MERERFPAVARLLVLGCLSLLVLWILMSGVSSSQHDGSENSAGISASVPQQPEELPPAVPTVPAPIELTPTMPEPTVPPTVMPMGTPDRVYPSTVTEVSLGLDASLSEKTEVNGT